MDLKNLIPSFGRKSIAVKREEEHPFVTLHREMNRLFDGFLQDLREDGFPDTFRAAFTPCIDMTEDDKAITVSAELPGMTEKDIEVSLTREALTIRGEKKDEKERLKDNCLYMERSFGSFTRTVRLPREIDSDKVQARFEKGILKITLPKTGEARKEARKIAVTAE